MRTSTKTDSNSVTSISVSTTAETTEIKETAQKINYILNISTGKFHYPDCPSVDLMSEENKLYYTGSKEDLLEYGYSSCGRCKP